MLLKVKCITAFTFLIHMLILNPYVLSSNYRLNITNSLLNITNSLLNIERGDQDTFDNPNCKGSNVSGCNCNGSNAACVNSNCKRCKCSTYKTFLSSNDANGRCVKDHHLLFIPSFSKVFSVQNKMCMKPQWDNTTKTYRVRRSNCRETDSWQHWIWTRYNQLMHVNSSKCLQQGRLAYTFSGSKYNYLVLAECNSTETKQLWKCQGQNIINFWSKTTKFYMYQGSKWYTYGTDATHYNETVKWKRFPGFNKTLCSKAFGCYEFKYPSAILVTEMRKCKQQCLEEKEISVPKTGENLCFVMWEKLQYLDNQGKWRQLYFRDEIFTIDKRDGRTFLKLNFSNARSNWTGLIVKLNFYCSTKKFNQVTTVKDIKCVVVKFKETVIYTTTAPSTMSTVITPGVTKYRTYMTITTGATKTTGTTKTTGITEKYKSDSSPVVIIVVCVVIAILILCGILGFIYYKRKRRSVVHKEVNSPAVTASFEASMNPVYSPVDNKPTPFFSGDEETYLEPQIGASQECELYEPADGHVYESADVELNGKRIPPQEHAYDYAKSDVVRPVGQRLLRDAGNGDISRIPVENEGKDSHSNDETGYKPSPVYQTLEEPSVDN